MRYIPLILLTTAVFTARIHCKPVRLLDTDRLAPAALVEHETATSLPSRWYFVSEADDNERLRLRVSLAHSRRDYLRVAEAVSDPLSPSYGIHLSASELQALLPDMQPAGKAVKAWLSNTAAQQISSSGDFVDFETTVAEARTLLKADFARYSFRDGPPVLRTRSYSIPADLVNKIDFIYPTTQFLAPLEQRTIPSLEARQITVTGPPTCARNTCPAGLRQKYKINYEPPDNRSNSRIGIAGFLEQYPNTKDLHAFLDAHGLRTTSQPYSYRVETVNGGKNPQSLATSGVEAMLDLEYAAAFSAPLDLTYYSTGGRPVTLSQPGNKVLPSSESNNEPYLAFLQYLVAQKAPPQVLSISYSDDEQTVPVAWARKVCDLFAQLAARGTSVIVASGDGGASGSAGGDCKGPNGKLRFVPTFPSSCPWVTSVGATASDGGAATFSSGGFSNLFTTPSWQTLATQHYIKALNGSHAGFYNAIGRGIPDVALLGQNYLVISGGKASSNGGTSASTPVFAAMVALLNDIRLRAGKPVLGFLNPLLYSAKVRSAFIDVTEGESAGCVGSNTFESGFEALSGWDAVTGLGEADFQKLRTLMA